MTHENLGGLFEGRSPFLVYCEHTGLTVPECSCPACITNIVAEHAPPHEEHA